MKLITKIFIYFYCYTIRLVTDRYLSYEIWDFRGYEYVQYWTVSQSRWTQSELSRLAMYSFTMYFT
jgi:hypothetical protein